MLIYYFRALQMQHTIQRRDFSIRGGTDKDVS
jgi:hypothetical protein